MITGVVNNDREAIIRLAVYGSAGQKQMVEAINLDADVDA